MAHQHDHSHGHHHHSVSAENINTAFYIGIVLNILFVAIEAGIGFWKNSLSLLTDAGHNLSDVASLIISLLAFKLAAIKANNTYTYGYKKGTILASLTNGIILLLAVILITYKAIERFINGTVEIAGLDIAFVAGIGILINGFTAYLFFKDQDKDLNIKGAYLHLLADALVSLGVVIGGIIIYYTNWFWIDTALSLIIAIVILYGTWGLLKDSFRLALDGVPKDIDINKIKALNEKYKKLHTIEHIHIWAISTTENALTAHLIVEDDLDIEFYDGLKADIKHDLLHFNIQHATLEIRKESSEHEEQCYMKSVHNEHHKHDENNKDKGHAH